MKKQATSSFHPFVSDWKRTLQIKGKMRRLRMIFVKFTFLFHLRKTDSCLSRAQKFNFRWNDGRNNNNAGNDEAHIVSQFCVLYFWLWSKYAFHRRPRQWETVVIGENNIGGWKPGINRSTTENTVLHGEFN